MTELVIAGVALVLGTYVLYGFCLWLRLRERERLSATDKTEILGMLKAVDGKLLELKNSGLSRAR